MAQNTKLTSTLPYGKPFPIGDLALWNTILETCRGDAIKIYAHVRGLTRDQAKSETFTLRYGSPTGRLNSFTPELQEWPARKRNHTTRLANVDFAELEARVATYFNARPFGGNK